jgi:hypothetical protein
MLCVKALFTLPCDEHDTPNQGTSGAPRLCPAFMTLMDEDFIERTLRERRSLPDALTDMLAKYKRIPSGNAFAACSRFGQHRFAVVEKEEDQRP